MDSRPILKDAGKINVYVDSKTFEELLAKEDRTASAILRHYDSECLTFVRSPLETKHDELKAVVEYKFLENANGKYLEIVREDSRSKSITTLGFPFRIEDVQQIGRDIFVKDEISKDEFDRITTVFIQAAINRIDKSNIYITNDKVLLKKRLWFESHFPGGLLNIMSVGEAYAFLDLFFKKNGNYYASSRYHLNKGYWYWLSMRLKLPHFNVGDPMIDALAFRFYYCLMALDEMGIQFYLGSDNDTMDNSLYHFNYLISLITGIFDNLALKTNTQLGINFSDLRKVSLSNVTGREFLREIRSRNQMIRDHIASNMHFIKLVYTFRESVIHREGLSRTSFEYKDADARWKANFIRISAEQKDYIKLCGDTDSEFDPFSTWGVYSRAGLLMDPYYFSINALGILMNFVDEYLKLLGFDSFIEAQEQKDDAFASTLKVFEKDHLGF